MRKILLAAIAACAVIAPAHADYFNGHLSNGTRFSGNLNTGPQGFAAAGLANGLNNAAGSGDSGAALGSYLPGVITGADRAMQFEIQVSSSGGSARAFDPAKGEHYAGTYKANGGFLFVVTAGVTLIGDRGSRLTCQVTIHAGDTPTGSGECADRKNSRYQLEF